jgi:hypothetical protein
MVDVARDNNTPQAKILTSSLARKSGAIDPKAQIATDEVKGKGQQEEEAGRSSAPHRHVTPQILLNKFQRDRERQQRKEEEPHREKEH